jgi:hypothetical protein
VEKRRLEELASRQGEERERVGMREGGREGGREKNLIFNAELF